MSYSRSSYRASSSSYRFSSEGGAAGGDEGFTSSYKSTSRTGTGTGSRLSRLDSDDIGLSTTRRNTRPREESFESTSSSRVSGRLYDRKDSDDDFSTSKRIASRTASRTEDSGSYSRKYSRGLSADLDSSTGVDSYLSTRKTSRSHGLDDSSNDYLISKKTSRDYGEESSSTTRKYSGRIYAALEDDLDTSGSGIASTIRSSRITSKLTEDENYGLSATTKRGLSRLGSTEDDGLAIGSGGLTASGRYKRSESQESSLLYRQSSNVSDEGSFKSSNRKRSLDRVDSYKSYKASALDEDRPVSPSFRLKSRSSTINEENIYVAVLDYSPPKSAQDEIELKEGQEVIVLNKDKPHKWKVQTRPCKQNRISEEGFVPSCYLEQKTPYDPSHPVAEDEPEEIDPKIEEAKKRRKNVLKELVETEEDFNRDMQFIANTYLKHMDSSIMPKELRDQKVPLFGCFKEIADFHNDVLMKGVQYYAAEDPSKVGNTFLRLERDFDKHVRYCHDLPQAQKLLESGPLKDYFDNYSSKIKDDKSLADHLKLPVQRINDYQLLLKELIKYSNRLGEDSGDLCKALELMRVIPQRATDLQFINNMIGYKGNLHKSGRLLKHVLRAKDWFQVIQDESSEPVERYVFLFTRQLITTDVVNLAKDRQGYVIKTITKLEDVNFEDVDDLTINVQHKEPGVKGFPFKLQAKTAEIIKSWKQEIQDVRKLAIEELADIPDPEISDDGTDCLKLDDISKGITPEPLSEDLTLQQLSGSQVTSDIDTKVGLAEDLATNDGSNTVMTESLRSGSVTDIEACDLEAKPVFRQPLKPVNQHVGEKAVLECQVKSALPVNVTWLKDNAKLRESENVQFITSSDKFILTIDGITNDDSGLYTVIASNDKGKTSSSAALNVKQDSLKPDSRPTTPGGSVLPHPPKFKIKLKDTELLEGTTVRFEMIVRGLPIPNVTFYKDDKPLITDDRVRIIYENKEIFELFIDHVKPEDAGVYKAIAINTHGEDSTSGKVTITKHKDIFKGLEDDHFLGEPESLDISRADSRSSRPRTPAFRWFKDGQEFEASERFQCTFDDEEDTIALIFQHVTPDDAGLYTCVASTSSGKISCSAELSVQGEVRKLLREPEKPAVKVPISDIEVNEGASAMLEAKITGYPKPLITWYKDNEEIKVDEKYKFLYEDEESYTLVIKGVRRDDASKYRLKASNDLGEVETSGQLTVNSAPKVKRELKDQSVMTDEPMTLDVVVEGTPTPTAKWFKDGQPVKLDDRVKIVDKDETHSLVIDPVKLEDAGNYTCIVSNSCGQQTGQSVVTVNSPPKFQLGLKDVSAKDGDTIEFKVKVSGNPEPEVVLMKDGKKLDRQISTEKEAEVYRFKIRSTTVEDTGKYQCVAKNQYGSETSEGSLTIVTKPSFDKRLEDIECKEGDTNVDLKVKISGSPRPKVRWLFEEEEISQSSKRTEIIEEEDGVFILRIKEASLETAGKYTIVAVNSEGEVRSSGIVDVKKDESKQYDQRKPVFGQKLRDLEALETDLDVTFKASIEEPDKTKITSIRWYIDDIEITESDRRFKIMSDDSIGVFKLVVRRPDESVEGKYKLIVENPYGYDETNASFTIMREPKFIKKLRDKDIDVNDKLTLTVKVDGVPEPTLTWFKDEQEITKISEKVVIGKIDDAYSLTIDSAQSVDEGVYKCSAKNKIGEDSTSARITVLSPPNFTKGLTDISVSADLDLTLEVQVTGADKVEWYKDGLKICEATSEADGITHRLPLKSVKLDDAGDYKAVARNAFGRVDSGTGHLTVKTENKEAPKFVEPLTDVAVQSGEDVTFTVKVTGSPTPKVIWSINGKEVTPSDHIIVSDLGNNTHSLTVKGSQTDDQASYSVSAVNDSGKAQDEAKLTIKVAAEKPKISGLKDIEIERGSTALIGCTVTGSPKPEVVWMKDGVKLSTGDEFEIISDSDTKHSIYVKKASESTQGTYIVSAKNIEGSSEADVKLTLIAEPPKFIKNLTDCSGSLGSELTLEAEVKGFPPPVVSWYKNGSELIESSEAFVSQVGTLNKLSLKDLKSSDAGEYTCKAENKAGEANSTAKISIEKPELIKGLPDSLNGKQGDVLKLEAKLSNDSTNEPIKWLKDGKEIPQNDRLKTKILPDGTLILTIEDAQPEDSGVYQVVVGNDGPNQVNSSSNVSVSPKEFVKPNVEPKFIEDLHDVSVKEGSPFKMEAKVTGHPKPEICWFKDDEPISPNPHCGFISEPDGTIGLMFDHCNGDDAGRYKAIATNSSGEVITTGKLTVDKPTMKPSFSADLSPVDVAEGQPLVLTGVVDGHPPPNIKWLKDGEEIKPNSRITMSQSPDGTVTLSINSASPDDEGKYTVAAANDEGRVRSSAPVSVRRLSRSLSKPSFDEGLKPTTLKAGEPATLSVAVSGEPSPEVKWLKDGHPIEPDDRHHFTDKPPNTKCLTIDDVKPEDAGNYSVVAGNDLGEDKTSAPIKVNQSPRFVKPLDGNIEAVDGFPIKLEVKTEGEPKPELTWFKDGETIIPDGDRLRIINEPDGVSSLIITKTLPNDKGHYSCAAVNPLGTNKTEGDVSVGPTKKNDQAESVPRLIKNLSDCEVDEGKTMKFEAHIEGNPINEVKWFRNGEPLTIGSNIVPYFDGKRAGLEIRNCGPMDQGDYEVKLGNSLGTISSKSRGIVRSRDPPKFTQKLIDSTFGTKSPISLYCRVSGNPEPEVQWYHNGKLIEAGLKYQLKRESNLLSLIINNPTSNDGGTIECRATNPVGSDSTRCSIKVSDRSTKEEPAAFIKRFNEYECTEGQSAKFTACIVGNPKPELKWFKDGKDFEPTSRHLIDVETNGIVRLTIRNVEPADVGEYQLFISNPHGNDSSSAKLTIDNMDKKYRRRSMDVGKELSKRSGLPSGLLEKPRIIRMWDTGISLGWKPAIPSYSGIPVTYTLDWCKHPYSDSDWKPYRTGILDNRCDIRNLEPGQDYSFRVRVENKLGVSDPSPVVTAFRSKLIDPDAKPKDYEIERPPIDKIACAPRWLRKEDDEMYGIRGRPVTIIFWVYGYPEPDIKWFFNDIEIQIGTGNYDVMKDRNGKVCLFINRMTEKDVGTYSCHATNEHGEAWKKIKLLQAEPPSFILRLKETTGMAYKSTRMECKVTGIPMPTVKWFKDWLPIHDSDRTKILWEESENRSTLFINSTISRDAGLYSVTATNVVGSASCSANLAIEDDEILFNWANYIPRVIRPRKKALEDYYDLGDELGRGTQGVTYHAVERASGNNYAIKMMHGKEDTKPFMDRELEMMNQFFHPKLVRLWDAFDHKETLALITDICGGGELLEAIVGRGQLTEKEIANYIRQILEGLNHMHGREIGHFGLTIGDILLERIDGEDVKIADFSLSRRLIPGKSVILEYGHPEFVAPEIVNKQPISLAADLWSVGVLTYILLTGISPFLGQNDRETLSRLKEGKISFSHETFVHVSEDAKDFLSKLLIIDPTKRLDVKKALEHRWISGDSINHREDKLPCIDALKEYLKKWRDWYKNASCRKYYRRNPLDYCFEHPSKMIYPPDEPYKPSEPPVVDHKPKFKPSEMDDSVSPRPGYDPANFTSESQYQSGPDTYLLPHRDVDFPLRIREYLRVGASRSPSLANSLRSSHWGDTNLGIGQRCSPQVAVRERRRFVEVMDEEIEDERKGLDTRTVPMRLQHEIGTPGYAYGQIHQLKQEAALHLGRDVSVKIVPPFFREKIKDVVVTEGSIGLFSCFAVGEPKPTYTWFRNDGIIIESPRISVKQLSSGRVELTINPVHAYDAGCYKCVARNEHGAIFCRARLRIGTAPEKPEPPEVRGTSATEAYLVWSQPKGLGNSWITSYSLEYSIHGTNEWNILVDRLSQEFYLVRNLSPGTSYTFRVKAKNKFGWSEFSEPSEPSTTAPVGSDVRISLPRGQKEKLLIGETLTEAKWEELAAPDLDYSRERQPIEMKQGIEPTALYHTSSDEIARGHFSVIIKAACKETEKPLALKICLVENQASSGIMNEYEMLKSLCHERIVSLYSATCGSDTIALGMERLSGVDVLTYLSQSTVYSEDTVTRIIQQVLDGIEYLHFQGICMLELQPDNIVLINNHFPNIKLIDFANARHVPPNGTKVTIKGSPEYLAPEIIKREEVSTATDIWCVGILAYILLSGASPFKGETEEETIENVSYVRYHFDHLYKEVTQEAIRFLMLVFKRSPSKRPTIEECSDHKWLMPNEYAVRKRESTLFSSNKLAQFNENLRSDKSCSTPDKLLKILGIS